MLNPNITIKNLLQNPQVDAVISLIARLLIAYIFIVAGWGKSQPIVRPWVIWSRREYLVRCFL